MAMPIRKPDLLAGVVNSWLRSGAHPLIFCERIAGRAAQGGRLTVTYPAKQTDYLTLGQVRGYLSGKPFPPHPAGDVSHPFKD